MRVKCRSGLTGEQSKLQTRYKNFEEFAGYSEIYGLHRRLKFRTARAAWNANPTIQSSVEPSDFRVVKAK